MAEIKPELSHKNKYWIPKHRYYELRHFCLQYPEWKKLYLRTETKLVKSSGGVFDEKKITRPVETVGILREELSRNIRLVERVCREADSSLEWYILKSVTEGTSYTRLLTMYNIPCSKDMFYDRYRKFFWLLSGLR